MQDITPTIKTNITVILKDKGERSFPESLGLTSGLQMGIADMLFIRVASAELVGFPVSEIAEIHMKDITDENTISQS